VNITLKEFPEDLHLSLRRRAEAYGRSLNKEVLTILEAVVNPVQRSAKDLLTDIEERRARMPHIVKESELNDIIKEGRQ